MSRYSVDNPAHIGLKVFLDGREVKDVTQCDTAEGWLIRYARDENGDFVLSGPGRDTLTHEKLTGVVTVEAPA